MSEVAMRTVTCDFCSASTEVKLHDNMPSGWHAFHLEEFNRWGKRIISEHFHSCPKCSVDRSSLVRRVLTRIGAVKP